MREELKKEYKSKRRTGANRSAVPASAINQVVLGIYKSSFTDFLGTCLPSLICPIRYPFNLGYKDYEKTLQDIDLDIVSYPPCSFIRPSDDLSSANFWKKKVLQGDLKLKSATRSVEEVCILSPVNSDLVPLSNFFNVQPQNPVQRALDSANATLNRWL